MSMKLAIVRAFLLGVWEFRLSFTTCYEDLGLESAYDKGREFAHKVTFRYFDGI